MLWEHLVPGRALSNEERVVARILESELVVEERTHLCSSAKVIAAAVKRQRVGSSSVFTGFDAPQSQASCA